MRILELQRGLKLYKARIKFPKSKFQGSTSVNVYARNPAMARRQIQSQYGKSALIGNVKQIRI